MADKKERNRKRKASAERKALNSQLRKDRKNITVEIMNVSHGICRYTDINGRVLFDLEPGEIEVLSLEELTEVNNRCKGFFKKYKLIVIDVMSDEYKVEDVLGYLGVLRYYEEIENKDEDFLETLIYDEDYDEFKDVFRHGSNELKNAIAGRLLLAYRDPSEREYIEKAKIKLVGNKLGLMDIIEEILTEEFNED